MTDLYAQLRSPALLRQAWHLARVDAHDDFALDAFAHSDYGHQLDHYIDALNHALATGTYRPSPIATVDIPKSTLSVRPGAVLAIEDKIVLYAIALLLAPRIDRHLAPNVYSWRVRSSFKKKRKGVLFEKEALVRIPFLRRKTIQRELQVAEPWYDAWPRFHEYIRVLHELRGYNYVVTCDIAGYFENIDLGILKDILLRYLPREQRIVNFLIRLLEFWAWPTSQPTFSAARGIPQGNEVSSFLGNIYLLPLDVAFGPLRRRKAVEYLRYMDDVTVVTRDIGIARDALLLMNRQLRELRLTIQGSKTRILQGREVADEFIDARLDEVNDALGHYRDERTNPSARATATKAIRAHLHFVRRENNRTSAKGSRLFRRLVSVLTELDSSELVSASLDELERNPDLKIMASTLRYLTTRTRNRSVIARRLERFLRLRKALFPYQDANVLRALRHLPAISAEAFAIGRRRVQSRSEHWYTRAQSALLLAQRQLTKSELEVLEQRFHRDTSIEVRRALAVCLTQLPRSALEGFVRTLLFSPEPRIQRLGRLYYGLLFSEGEQRQALSSLFHGFTDTRLIDRLYEMEILARTRNVDVLKTLQSSLERHARKIKRAHLRARLARIRQLCASAAADVSTDANGKADLLQQRRKRLTRQKTRGRRGGRAC